MSNVNEYYDGINELVTDVVNKISTVVTREQAHEWVVTMLTYEHCFVDLQTMVENVSSYWLTEVLKVAIAKQEMQNGCYPLGV